MKAPDGRVKPRKKKLSKAVYGTSHTIRTLNRGGCVSETKDVPGRAGAHS